MVKFLVIQTAFTGDVVLATALVEKLHTTFPDAQIDFLLRKGNEGLLQNHPFVRRTIVWDKKNDKLRNLLRIAGEVRAEQYDRVVNAHRFASSGLVTCFSGAKQRAGFRKNPWSFGFTRRVKHEISKPYTENPVHEIQRNQLLIADITGSNPAMPRLYPPQTDYEAVRQYQEGPYVCIAPSSVWQTKQFPAAKWVELINRLPADHLVHLLGGPADKELAHDIACQTRHSKVRNLAGELSYLQSAALMQGARMNYANDSAPLHFASAMGAKVTAVFCSTVPAFGFGPLTADGHVVEAPAELPCRPCGLHGRKECPEGHFRCAYDITTDQLLWWTLKKT